VLSCAGFVLAGRHDEASIKRRARLTDRAKPASTCLDNGGKARIDDHGTLAHYAEMKPANP
jgi:hypothetical protein